MNTKYSSPAKYVNAAAKILLAFASVLGSLPFASAQVSVPFTQRTSKYSPTKTIYNVKGDFQMIGNTNLTLVTYTNTTNNSNNQMKLVDADCDASTTNSSSATLTLSTENGAIPSCSNIIFAGLYWTGRTSNSETTEQKRSIKFKGPGEASYQNLLANSNNIKYPGDDNMYASFVEVTDLVKLCGVGEYWVADMALTTGNGGSTGYYGGWGMVVVYENSKMNWRDVTLFDGYAYVQGGTYSYELPVSGFHTARSGSVNMKLGLMAGEGDIGISGDYFQIRNQANTDWVSLSHGGNTPTNFFNSSIYTGGGARNPNLLNNTGIDISMFNIPNAGNSIITNDQTSTTFKYGSTQDTYIIYSMAMSVDAYVPYPEGLTIVQDIGGNPPGSILTALPGQDVDLKLEIRNKGTEAISNTKILIPVPFAATYVSSWRNLYFSPTPTPNQFYFDPSLGANGTIVWNLGTLPVSADPNAILATISYKLMVTEDCMLLSNSSCASSININGTFSGMGAVSNALFNDMGFIQGFETNGSCVGEPIRSSTSIKIDASDYVAQHCQAEQSPTEFVFCNVGSTIPITEVLNAAPVGSRFYNSYPITPSTIEYTISNPFPAIPGLSTYYAVPPGNGACYFTFKINVTNITSVPVVNNNNIIYCQGDIALRLMATPSNPAYTLYYFLTPTSPPQLSITPSTTTTGQTTYYVAEGKSGSCVSPNKAQIIVTVNPLPEAPVSASVNRQIFCADDNGNIVLTETGGLGTTLEWYSGSCNGTPIGTGNDLSVASPTVTTTYFARWTNSCGSSACAEVIIPVPTAINAVASAGNIACYGVTTTLTVNATGGTGTLQYSLNGGTYQSGNTFTINASGSPYSVTVKDANNCTSVSNSVIVSQPASISLSTQTLINVSCLGERNGKITLTASGGTGTITYSISPNVGTQSPSGTFNDLTAQTYTITAQDQNGCTISDNITVGTDNDATLPTISCPADVSATTNTGYTATGVVLGTPTTSDNCGVTIVTNNAPAAFPLGVTIVTWTVTDNSGNKASCDQKVTVTDNELPIISCPADITVNTNAGCTATGVFLGTPTTSDNCGVATVTNNAPAAFPLGVTTVTWTVSDNSGNKASCDQKVTVADNVLPTITCPADITATTNTGCTATGVVLGTPTTSDNCGVATVTNNAPAAFPLGVTTVTWTVTDNSGNKASCDQKVTVADNELPTISCPADISATTNNGCTATLLTQEAPPPPPCQTGQSGCLGIGIALGTPVTSDNCGIAIVTNNAPAAFPLGVTTVTWTVTDNSGNKASCDQKVTVTDNVLPTITCPADITATTNTGCTATGVVLGTPTTSDNCGIATVTNNAPAAFPLGVTTVTWTVTDNSG
ncbi:MAG: HYR domain-containing protein, partial [Lentimicrobiaceae bacterium]